MLGKIFKDFDWVLIIVVLLLVGFGILTVYSTTFKSSSSSMVFTQGIAAFLGLIIMLVLSRIDYRIFKKFTGILYVIMIGLLIAVEFVGVNILGATRWIDLGFTQLQPSEVAKFIIIVCLAKYFSDHNEEMWRLKNIFISFAYVLIPMVLVLREPDLGTALVLFAIWASMLFVSSVKRLTLLKISTAALAFLPVVWLMLHDYQRNRILTLFNPSDDALGKGWNVTQAVIAIGSGQIFGRGFGYGSQGHLNFLPMKHTDFAFAVLAEEMGFLGVGIIIALFLTLVYRIIAIARNSRDNFGMFMAVGAATMFCFHVFVNIGMNTRIMPVTGIPLPFISYGGTAILINLAVIGLLQSIHIRHKKIAF